MKRTCFALLCALAALFWLAAAQPVVAWESAPDEGAGIVFTAQAQPGDGLQEKFGASERRPRGGGGFGLQIIPIILIIPLAWFFLRSMNRRDGDDQGPSQGKDRYSHEDDPENMSEAYRRARAQWEWMSGEAGASGEAAPKTAPTGGGFDPEEFLQGAKLAYSRLTDAFDRLDVEAARPFAAQAVLDGLEARAASGAAPGETEIVLVEAELLEHDKTGDREEATVLYDALVRRGPDAGEPEQLKQVWRFARDPREPSSTWRLERMEPFSDNAS